MARIPPPPPGFTLDPAVPPPPPGFTLDTPGIPNRAMLDMSQTQSQPQEPAPKDQGIMGTHLSPALNLANRFISDSIPNPTLGNVVQGARQGSQGVMDILAPTGPRLGFDTVEAQRQDIVSRSNAIGEQRKAQRADYEQKNTPDVLGEMIGATIPQALVSKTMPGTGGAGVVSRYAVPAANAALTAFTTTPGDTGTRATSGAIAGASTPIMQGGVEVTGKILGWLGNKTADALAGTKLGKLFGIKTELNPKYAGAPELSTELDKAGITHTVGDITSDPKVLSYEAGLARRDPRMMDLRVQQNQQGTAYAEQVIKDLQQTVKDTGWENLDDLKAAVELGGKRSGQAQALLTAIENSGDDWKKIAQNSGNLKLFVNKLRADQLYDKAEAIAAQYGPVKASSTLDSAKRAVSSLTNDLGADSPNAPHMLQDIATKLEDGNHYSFRDLRDLRSRLNNKISQLTDPKAVAPPLDVELNAYKNVLKGVESDLDRYANGHPFGLRKAWKEASDYYKGSVVPYKDNEMGKILADQDPLALGRLFQGKDKYAQERMFGLMGAKGQAATRAGLIQDAVAAGEKMQRGSMSPTMSAARVASALEKLDANGTMDIAFKGEDKWAAQGLGRIMRTIDKSDTIAWMPPTGESAERLGSMVKGDTTVLGAAAKGVNWLNKERLFQLYSDPKGRALLIRASDLSTGSPALKNLISVQIPKFLGIKLGNASKPDQELDK
jgi:hypothetical protein